MLRIDLAQPLGDFTLEIAADLPPGVTMVFGPSGAGKTSLVRAVAGLSRGARGEITLNGRVLLSTETGAGRGKGLNLPAHQRRIGYVFQEPRLFAHMSVRANLTYGAPRGTDPGGTAEMLEISHLLDRRPAGLSGGEAARVSLGRALLRQPELLILDEPLAALDQRLKNAILPCLARLRDEARIPMLYVTHSFDEVLHMGTHLMVLRAGRVQRFGALEEVLADPAAARDLGPRLAGAILPGRVLGRADGLCAVDTPAGVIEVASDLGAGAQVRLRIMAQDVLLATARPTGISALNVLPVRIAALVPGAGPGVMVRLEAGGQVILARVTKRSVARLELVEGSKVFAVLKTVAVAPGNVAQAPDFAPR